MKNLFLILAILAITIGTAQKKSLLVGTYTKSCDSKGIYVYDFDSETGDLVLKNNSEQIVNPSYLTWSANKKVIYAVNEDGDKSTVSSFDFDKTSGSLKRKSNLNAEGADPCYIINDQKNVITANYSGGSITVFGKNADGSLGTLTQVVKHDGSSSNPKRQESSHVHMVQFSLDNKFVLAADLGTDKIYVYEYFKDSTKEVLKFISALHIKKGSGPRHFVLRSGGRMLYVLNELSGTISVFELIVGKFQLREEYSVLAKNYKDEPRAAHILISPDGKVLYASNRESANDISIFRIKKKGHLEFVQRQSTLGIGPRNFTIDPSGNFLLVGNQKSNEIVVFRRDKTTGLLTDTGKKTTICAPVCLVFE